MALQTKVFRVDETHQYFDDNGLEYMSVSRLLNMISPVFNRDLMATMSAKKKGVSKESLLKEWDEKTTSAQVHGTRIHDALENYILNAEISKENADLEFLIKTVCSSYNEYYRRLPEEILYNEEFRLAGASDLILLCSNHKSSKFDIEDFKTNVSKGIQFYDPYGKNLLHPLEHLEACNYNKYALQLSFYAYMMEKMTGKKLRKMNILFIPPENTLAWRRIPVPYMKLEVEAILNFYKGSILKAVMGSRKPAQKIETQTVAEMPNFDM